LVGFGADQFGLAICWAAHDLLLSGLGVGVWRVGLSLVRAITHYSNDIISLSVVTQHQTHMTHNLEDMDTCMRAGIVVLIK